MRQRRVLAGLGLVTAAFLAVPLAAFPQTNHEGGLLYERLECAACHATSAAGDIGPALAGTERTLTEVIAQLRNPRGMMPAFGPDRLSDEEIADIYAWLQQRGSEPTYPTWFGTDLINMPTPLMPGKRTLEVHFTHRFSESVADAGRQGFWGLDSFAVPTFWFAYGIVDWLQVHGGRSSNRATWEYGAKIEMLEEGQVSLPVAASVVIGGAYLDRDDVPNKSRFTAEFPIGWRVHERFSILAVPFLATNTDVLDAATSASYSTALGIGGTFRVTPGQSIEVEWVTNLGGFKHPDAVDQWQVFWGIKVGGHLFQLGVTNAVLYTPDQMAPGVQEFGQKGEVRIGFNLVRQFHIGGGG